MATLIATPCGSGGWIVGGTTTQEDGCTRIQGRTDRWCCNTAGIRSHGLGAALTRLLAGQQPSTTGAEPTVAEKVEQAMTAVTDGIVDAVSGTKDATATQVLTAAGNGKGGDVVGGGVVEAGMLPSIPPSWLSLNWPYLALGGVAIVGVSAILYFTTRISAQRTYRSSVRSSIEGGVA